MRMRHLPGPTLVLLLLVGTASAQATRPLDNLAACRLDDGRVALNFTFEGGACQQPGTATVEPARGGVAAVTVPTEATAEVCTMQVVPVEVTETLAVDAEAITLDITVLARDGRPQALGSTDIATAGPACEVSTSAAVPADEPSAGHAH